MRWYVKEVAAKEACNRTLTQQCEAMRQALRSAVSWDDYGAPSQETVALTGPFAFLAAAAARTLLQLRKHSAEVSDRLYEVIGDFGQATLRRVACESMRAAS
mmetsp:Transcript_111143/g.346382  ORF Transcript_111143/g.346382 Transcript_111143/m.346382 type:complete len:102 (-) Transcript_111143:81-386(-)